MSNMILCSLKLLSISNKRFIIDLFLFIVRQRRILIQNLGNDKRTLISGPKLCVPEILLFQI